MTYKTVVQGASAAALVLATIMTPPAAAQYHKLELTPFFTSYYSVAKLADFNDQTIPLSFEVKQIAAPGIGARLTYWMPSGLGFEATGTYVFSGARIVIDDPTGALGTPPDQSLPGKLLAVTGRVLYRLPRSNFHLFAGAGTVNRSGDVWVDSPSLSDVTGVAGFGARAAVTPKLTFDVRLEAYMYSFNTFQEIASDVFKSEFQTDFHVSIGIPLALMK